MKFTSPAHSHNDKYTSHLLHGHTLSLEQNSRFKATATGSSSNVFGTFKDLPIRGRAQGGDEGCLVIEDQPIDWTYRPADLQGVHGAFAVFVTGDSMEPKYKNQDLAYIHPTLHLRRGRYVLVETSEHGGFIKQFDRWENNTLVVKQLNPAKDIRIRRENVRKVMMVIGSLDA